MEAGDIFVMGAESVQNEKAGDPPAGKTKGQGPSGSCCLPTRVASAGLRVHHHAPQGASSALTATRLISKASHHNDF